MVLVRAPLAGRVGALASAPDAVFASGLLGEGMVLDPLDAGALVHAGVIEALAPVDGILAAVQPHAYAVQPEDGPAILVHLGIDTVSLAGEGFAPLAERGALLRAGDGVIAWDPTAITDGGLAALVPVIAMQGSGIRLLAPEGSVVAAGDSLFEAD